MGTSYQKGWVRLRGKKWYGYFRRMEIDPSTSEPKPAVAQVILGFKSEMSKSQAREKLEGEIAKLGKQPLNGDKSMVNGAVTFGWFVLHRYLPLKEADWRDETAKVKKHLIQADLVDEFGDVRLENFDKFTLQTHLNKLAKTRSRDRVLQIRAYIKAIFAEAVDQDFLPKDPARTLKTPANLRETDKTVLSWEQLAAALARLGLRDRILLKLDMTNALRPSELFAFRWKCHRVEAVSLTIVETIYKGKIRSYGKTKGSLTEVPIAKDLSDDLLAWRQVCQEQYDKRKRVEEEQGQIWLAAIRPGGVSLSGRVRLLHGPEQLSQAGPAQAGRGARLTEAHVPGHPTHDRDAGPEEGHSEGCSGNHAALACRNHDRHLYAGDCRREFAQLSTPSTDELTAR